MNVEDYLREEENFLEKISFPSIDINENFIIHNNTIDINDNEEFKGNLLNGKLQKGIYIWHDGQIFNGNFYPNNFFNGKGTLTFNSGNEIYGSFSGDKNLFLIKNAIYKTNDKIYQGSFKNNLLHGKFIIKNNEENKNMPYYLYIGSYNNGRKNGNFILKKGIENNEIIEIEGTFHNGVKNGNFKLKKFSSKGNEYFTKDLLYENDYIVKHFDNNKKIENKNILQEIKEKKEIFCMKIIDIFNKKFLLLGSEEYLFIYNINDDIISDKKKLLIFQNGNINDILKPKDDSLFRLLLCSNINKFKLIELRINSERLNNHFSLNINNLNRIENIQDYKLIQEFSGNDNSNNIFTLLELSNKLVVSGDCQNIIVWEKEIIKEKKGIRNINQIVPIKKNFFKNLLTSFNDCYKDNCPKTCVNDFLNISEENQEIFSPINTISVETKKNEEDEIEEENINYIYNKKYIFNKDEEEVELTHCFCILEIKENDDMSLIAVAQPYSKFLYFLGITENNQIIQFKKIENIDSIKNRKKIMCIVDNNNILLVCCYNRIAAIDLNRYELIMYILFDTLTYISNYIETSFICGVMTKKEGIYNFEGILIQAELVKNEEKINIRTISEFKKKKYNGNIIEAEIFNSLENESIITIGTDGNIFFLK